MKSKQIISLLLAGQMLSAPMAQATSVSLLDKAQAQRAQAVEAESVVTPPAQPTGSPESPAVVTMPTPEASPVETPIATSEAAVSPPPSLVTTPEVTTSPLPSPVVTQEVGQEEGVIPVASPVVTTEATPVDTPTESPSVTPTATPAATLPVTRPEDIVTMPTATPRPETTNTTELPSQPPAQGAVSDGEGLLQMPAPQPVEPGATTTVIDRLDAFLPQQEVQPVELLQRAGEEWQGFSQAYVGYGYDAYHAGMPEVDGSVADAQLYGDDSHREYAQLAVEVPESNTDMGEVFGGYERSAYAHSNSYEENLQDSESEDAWTGENVDSIEIRLGRRKYFSLKDIIGRLGRIPDYEFDGWYASALGPTNAVPAPLWNYPTTDWVIAGGAGLGRTDSIIKIPLRYPAEDAPVQDYRLTDAEGNGLAIDVDELQDVILDRPDMRTQMKEAYYYGPDDSSWGDTGNDVKGIYLPIIAHWKLSGDARLVSTASCNADVDIGEEYVTEQSGLYLVKDGAITTVNILPEGERDTDEYTPSGITLYDKPLDDNTRKETTFDYSSSGTYYLRVTSDMEAISPVLLAAEAYKSAEKSDKSGVKISFRPAGAVVTDRDEDYTCKQDILNDSKDGKLYNNRQYPMRSKWTLESGVIPLTRSQTVASEGATEADKLRSYYNKLTITVVAPDGKGETTYTFYIQRLNDPRVVQNWGNTPFGMIARDTNEVWEKLVGEEYPTLAQVKSAAQSTWKETLNFFTRGYAETFPNPQDNEENNHGAYDNLTYYTGAWANSSVGNVDLDETAIIVYQNSSFIDPGITVYNSQGEKVLLDGDNLRRSLVLRVSADALSVRDLISGGVEKYYTGERTMEETGATAWEETFLPFTDEEGKDRIDLRGLRVIPGFYTIEYEYHDVLSGWDYNSRSLTHFSDKENNNNLTFTRTLIVLPIMGDVDMDGAVTPGDADLLRGALSPATNQDIDFFSAMDPDVAELYRYRVCDVNNDGVVDMNDVEVIRQNYLPYFSRNSYCNKYFYIPLHTGLTAEEEAGWHKRQAWSGAAEEGKAQLTLEYLGLNSEEISKSGKTNSTDPDKGVEALEEITNVDSEGNIQALEKNDVFWVGVKLSGLGELDSAAYLRGSIAGMKLTIAYDAQYLTPALIKEDGSVVSAVGQDEAWEQMLQRYNIGAQQGGGTATTDPYLWPSMTMIVSEGTNAADIYEIARAHYSKAILPGEKGTWNMKQMSVTLRNYSNAYRVLYNESEGSNVEPYLLRVPFILSERGLAKTTVDGFDLTLGMQDLSVLAVKDNKQTPVNWSTLTDDIFGGTTQNLSGEVCYVGGSARSIPLKVDDGKDWIPLYNNNEENTPTVYGESYTHFDSRLSNLEANIAPYLPKGLTYDVSGRISGVPEEVGRFAFEAMPRGESVKKTYYIDVEKAPLVLVAVGQKRYYGEENAALDYQYDTSYIKALDKSAAENADGKDGANYVPGFVNDGSSTMLAKLAGYMPPSVTTEVDGGTDAGSYTICISDAPAGTGLTNYKIVYADGKLNKDEATEPVDIEAALKDGSSSAQSPMIVEKRPLLLDKITATGMKGVVVNAGTLRTQMENVQASYQNGAADQGFELVDLSGESRYAGKLTPNAQVYGDDQVNITYTAKWKLDHTSAPYFDVPEGQPQTTKPMVISNVMLEDSGASKNYVLVSSGLRDTEGFVTILANPVVSIKVEGFPNREMEYIYGGAIYFYPMTVTLTYKDGSIRSTQYTNANSLSALNIHTTWVTREQMEKGESAWESGKPLDKQPQALWDGLVMHADIQDGKYLCVSVESYDNDGNPVSICWYGQDDKGSPKPFRVYKKELTLRVKPISVYYGEYKSEWLDYTYDPKELSAEDTEYIVEKMKLTYPTYRLLRGTSEELECLPGYTAPVLSAWVGAKGGQTVTADTPVLWLSSTSVQSYTITIENAKDDQGQVTTGTSNYSFKYMNGTLRGDEGSGALTIHPRPITVDSVTLGMLSSAFLYDDTSDNVLKKMYYTEKDEDGKDVTVARSVTVSGLNAPISSGDTEADAQANTDTFIASQPGGAYYKAYVTGSIQTNAGLTHPLSAGSAIHRKADGSMDKVVLTYTATYAKENPSAKPPETTYFEMLDQMGKTVTKRTATAAISELALAPSGEDNANANYILVFKTQNAANTARPANGNTQALLKLRQLKSIHVVTDPDREDDYTYGEQLTLTGMSISMNYENEGDNNPAQNAEVIARRVYYSETGSSNNFADQGLTAYWVVDDSLTFPEAGQMTQPMLDGYLADGKLEPVSANDGYPDVIKSGKRIILCGRRYSGEQSDGADADSVGHVLVWTFTTDAWNFKMAKKPLPLTVEGMGRFYGEPNSNYRASFPFSALAAVDQKRLQSSADPGVKPEAGLLYLSASNDPDESTGELELSTFATSAALSELNAGYLAPDVDTKLGIRFATSGTQEKNVGRYVITVRTEESGDGRSNLANYTFINNGPAILRVFRRPIVVTKVEKDPISTIFRNTEEQEFPALASQTGQMSPTNESRELLTQLPVADGEEYRSYDPQVLEAVNQGEATWEMPLTGDAIYGGDTLNLNMTAVFKPIGERETFPEGKYLVPTNVTIKKLVLGRGDAENYYLVYPEDIYKAADPVNGTVKTFNRAPVDDTAMGQLDRRPIIAIQNRNMPKMSYQYGEVLDLSELMLTVTFADLGDISESYETVQDLTYAELAGRMTVNYWPSDALPTIPGGTSPDAVEARKAAFENIIRYNKAASGDHLTIAPSHEERFKDSEGNYISHQGKYLILAARADESMDYQAAPILVGRNDSTPVAIQVEPLDLTYTLTAEDKVYDAPGYATRRAAAGTITLTNPYVTTDVVTGPDGQPIEQEDRDLIYVVADTAYTDEELKAYLNGTEDITEAYTFRTTGADQSDRIEFNFYDENVVYYDGVYTPETPVALDDWEAYWKGLDHDPKVIETEGWDSYGGVASMPVLVSGIRLAGPDRANYTLDGSVGVKNETLGVEDNPLSQNTDRIDGKDPAPFAVMEKAEQAIDLSRFPERPRVSVDVHSNTVRVYYDTDLWQMRPDDANPYEKELHYEYALEYMLPADPEAGTDSSMTLWDDWSDYSFFGGEKMESPLPEGYVPEDTVSSPQKDEVVKGQCYPWEAEDVSARTGTPLFGTRTPLDRNTVYWGMVRLAETHNYKPSAPVRAYTDGEPDTAAALALAEEQAAKARADAEELSALVLSWATEMPKEDDPEPVLGPGPAVKTYTQSFKVVSSEKKRGKGSTEQYDVDTLEAVWFTDIQQYEDTKTLSAVLRNLVKTRYHSFFWDQAMKTRLEMSQSNPLDLSVKPLLVKMEQEGGAAEVEVNIGDDPAEPRASSAVIYVSLTGGGNNMLPTGISVGAADAAASSDVSKLTFELGSDPIKLKLEVKPKSAMLEGVVWSSSDTNVVTVNADGWLTFVGVGTAEILVITRRTGKSAMVTVTVTDPAGLEQGIGIGQKTALELSKRENNHFDFYRTESFFELDGEYRFYPERAMTRAELVKALAMFYKGETDWKWSGQCAFPDLTGDESYAEAAEMLREMGILNGLPGGIFGGEQTATRAEVAAILCRMMGLPPEERSGEEHFFLDYGQHNGWADGYIDALAKAGVVNGAGNAYFAPDRVITRAELAAMLGRVLLTGVYYGDAPVIPSDVAQDHWAYGPILRAVNRVVSKTPKK